MEGFLLIDKPAGLTSHDVVDVVRKLTGEQRVGHAGTLDPFATGLLIVGVGRGATKLLGELTTGTTKTYEAHVRLGSTSATDDPEGPITEREIDKPPTKSVIQTAVRQLEQTTLQTPPAYSAIQVGGVRAYALARAGQSVEMKPRPVVIHAIRIRGYHWPDLELEISCGPGTYIRTIAHDLGEQLGCGAYLSALRRTAIGRWSVGSAITLSVLDSTRVTEALVSVSGVNIH